MLELHEQRSLLRLARQAIAARLDDRPLSLPSPDGALGRRTGAFVTIRHDDRLRGCIGSIETDEPLVEVVARCAGDAATRDPRFSPLPKADLAGARLEISVLGPFELVTDPTAIEVGRHGLVAEQRDRRGLLLPQVPTEWGWDRAVFLSQTCRKAGLAADAWRHGATLFRFEAFVFGE